MESQPANKLKVFISHAAEQQGVAESIYLTLTNSGHDVFFDRTSLPAGRDYNPAILAEIRHSDVFVFLISPHSVEDGAYARTELRFAQSVWKAPQDHVLPVMVVETPLEDIPEYLKAVTILEPEGNLVAEVAATIGDIASGWSPKQTVLGQAEILKNTRKVLEQTRLAQDLGRLERDRYEEISQLEKMYNFREEPMLSLVSLIFLIAITLAGVFIWPGMLILAGIGFLVYYLVKSSRYEDNEEGRRIKELDILERNLKQSEDLRNNSAGTRKKPHAR